MFKDKIYGLTRNLMNFAMQDNARNVCVDPFIFKFINNFEEEINDPWLFTQTCRDLFTPTKYKVVRTKWCDCEMLRFKRLVENLESGVPSFSEKNAVTILKTVNNYSGNSDYIDDHCGDVAWHFRASSSFASKGKLLFNAVQSIAPEKVIELGSAYGMSSLFMLMAMKGRGKLWTVEMNDPQYTLSKNLLTGLFPNVTCVKGMTQESLPAIIKESGPVNFVFHDAAHSKKDYIQDFEMLSLAPGSIIAFDDIHWNDARFVKTNPKCHEGWAKIVESDRVQAAVEIDGELGLALMR